jgi:glutaredoxin
MSGEHQRSAVEIAETSDANRSRSILRVQAPLPAWAVGDRRGTDVVVIYGKDSCPYTQAARDDYARQGIPFDYINVKKNAAELERMLVLSKGRRLVPVIVESDGSVTVGFGGT